LEATADEGSVEGITAGSWHSMIFEICDAPNGGKMGFQRRSFAPKPPLSSAETATISRFLEREKATRQQGGFFSRENSSNGGKAIRTFLAS
jgi:hypothetical protein